MNSRASMMILALSAICIGLAAPAYAAKSTKATTPKKTGGESIESKFRLKPGAELKLCLTCHPQFEDLLKKPSVHTPIKKSGCIACHSPHTTRYPKQLNADVSVLCLTCHDQILPKGARSTHRVALEGKCIE